MRNYARVYGHVGREPQFREFEDGKAVLSFTVATTESWKTDGQWREKTEWHRIAIKSPKAERLHGRLKKGAEVTVHGKLQTRDYEKNDEKRYVTEIVVTKSAAHTVIIHGKREQQESRGHSVSGRAVEPLEAVCFADVAARLEQQESEKSSTGGGFDDLPF